ncbi:MAG: hypothetical protein LBG07_00360 [Treponema sp.]|jgi:hypothetical protein|nr:hypothetical protein [Treponema sp.]
MIFSKPEQIKPKQPKPEQPETEVINRFQADGIKAGEEEAPPGLNTAPGNPLYRVLALYLPWSVLLSLLPPALALIRRLLPDLKLPGSAALGAAVYIPALLISAAVTLYLEFLDPRTSHSGAHLRGGILACAAAYLFSSILALRPPLTISTVTLRFLPSLGSVTAVLAALYIWIFVIYLRDLFRARELFESQIRLHRGEELRRVMLEDSAILSAAETRGLSAGRHYGIQTGIALLLVLLCDLLGAPLSIFQRIISILVPAVAALVFFLFSLFRREQFFAGEGIAVPPPERAKRIAAGTIFCAAATLLAALCASNNNILPISIITAFFAWLARLLSRPGRIAQGPIEIAPPNLPMEDPQAMLRFLAPEASEPWPIWDYLPYIALAAAIAVFLWFMIKPLFSLDRRAGKLPLILRLARLFSGGFAGLRRALKNFLASLRGGPGMGIKIPGEKIRDMTEELLSAWSKARKRELRQSLSLFARLILWGGREYQTTWKPSMGPGEYCALLSAAVKRKALDTDHEGGSLPPRPSPPGAAGAVLASPPPRGNGQGPGDTLEGEKTASPPAPPRRPRNPPVELSSGEKTAAAVLHCGAIFEEALYGPRLPDRETQREFRRLVEEITG